MEPAVGAGKHDDPIVVGGVGGSGTRLIAAVLREAGCFIGEDLNPALDNLWFSLLFNRPEILGCADEEFGRALGIFVNRMVGDCRFGPDAREWIATLASRHNPPHSAEWMHQRASTLLGGRSGSPPAGRWGWKEPNTHVVLPRLAPLLPRMRYVFVSRSGLDMAYSGNPNQAMRWGAAYVGRPFEPTPRFMLQFWCAAHRRVLAMAASMPARFMHIRLEDFCAAPEAGIAGLLEFLGGSDPTVAAALAPLAQRPDSIGRFREHGLDHFDPDDVAYVESLGFPVT